MPRKGEVRKREVLPDPKYGDKLVAKFVNTIMGRGKKSVAESIFYRSLNIVTAKTKEDSLGVFKKAIETVLIPSSLNGKKNLSTRCSIIITCFDSIQ